MGKSVKFDFQKSKVKAFHPDKPNSRKLLDSLLGNYLSAESVFSDSSRFPKSSFLNYYAREDPGDKRFFYRFSKTNIDDPVFLEANVLLARAYFSDGQTDSTAFFLKRVFDVFRDFSMYNFALNSFTRVVLKKNPFPPTVNRLCLDYLSDLGTSAIDSSVETEANWVKTALEKSGISVEVNRKSLPSAPSWFSKDNIANLNIMPGFMVLRSCEENQVYAFGTNSRFLYSQLFPDEIISLKKFWESGDSLLLNSYRRVD